jgi:hypothetical protein
LINLFKDAIDGITAKNLANAEKEKIQIRKISIERLIEEAANRYNEKWTEQIRTGEMPAMNPEQSVTDLSERQRFWVAAHIRHIHSNYDKAWQKYADMAGGSKAHGIIKRKVRVAIEATYPELLPSYLQEPKVSPATTEVTPILSDSERDALFAPLSPDERRTVADALTKHITVTFRPLNQVTAVSAAPPESRLFEQKVVREAFRRQTNFTDTALTYTNRPGFALAWDILYRATAKAFAVHYPTLSGAFERESKSSVRDWTNNESTLSWVANQKAESATLQVVRTTYDHMISAGNGRLTIGRGPAAYNASILDVCVEDFTNYTYEIAVVHGASLAKDPKATLFVKQRVLDAVAKVHPLLREAVTQRKDELREEYNALLAEIARKEASERERLEREQRERETQERMAQLRLAEDQERLAQEQERKRLKEQRKAEFTASKAQQEKDEAAAKTLAEQVALVRHLALNHPDASKYQREVSKAADDQKQSVTLFGMYQIHLAILSKRPHLSQAVALEVTRRETQIKGINRNLELEQEELKLSAQRAEVRQLVHQHPDVPGYQKMWSKLSAAEQPAARKRAMKAVHKSILAEHPYLEEAVLIEMNHSAARIVKQQKKNTKV